MPTGSRLNSDSSLASNPAVGQALSVLDQAVVEGRAAAEVGSALRSDVVGVAPSREIFFHHTEGATTTPDALAVMRRPQRIAAAVVEMRTRSPSRMPLRSASPAMHVEMRLTLELRNRARLGERRIEEMPCGREK